MAGPPTKPARVILTFIAPCYHNFVFIIETAEMAQYKFSTVFEYFYSNMQRTNCFINICEFVSNSIYRHVIYKY